MSDQEEDAEAERPYESPVVPQKLTLEDTFQFQCHQGIACFNKCCKSIDIILSPYDILRLKHRLGIDSRELLSTYSVPFKMDSHGMPGVKLRTKDNTTECLFLTDDGCSVYADRPAACRYYALGLLSLRHADMSVDEDGYFLIREEHCLGHNQTSTQSIGEYRQAQGVEQYDELSRPWRQFILKKRSAGPAVGQPTKRSFQMFFMASYNLDAFRDFVLSDGFSAIYDVDESIYANIKEDDLALLQFSYRLMDQVLFGNNTITLKQEGIAQRQAARG